MSRLTARLLAALLGFESLYVLGTVIFVAPMRTAMNRLDGGPIGVGVSVALFAALLAMAGAFAAAGAGLVLGWQRLPGSLRFADLLSVVAGLNLIAGVYVAAVLATSDAALGVMQLAAVTGAAVAVAGAAGCARAAWASSRRRLPTWS